MIQWAKFGQMARKGLRARPKSLKTMEKIATKAKKAVKKTYRKGHTSLLKTAKKNPNLVLLGGTTAAAVATYPLVKDTKYMKSRVAHRQKLLEQHYGKKNGK